MFVASSILSWLTTTTATGQNSGCERYWVGKRKAHSASEPATDESNTACLSHSINGYKLTAKNK